MDCVSWSPPFQAPFSLRTVPQPNNTDNTSSTLLSKKVDKWHDAAKEFSSLIHRPEAIYERLMGPGECVIFDNRRVLHARRAFETGDMGKERWLRGAYLDRDPFVSKMRVLGKKFGGGEIGVGTVVKDEEPRVEEEYFKKAADAEA